MGTYLVVFAALLAVLAAALLLLNWRERRDGEARWTDSMRKLTAYCAQFAAARGLTCVSGVDEWPYGWPRIHGAVDGAAVSLAFGWERKDTWVASMRIRSTGAQPGEFRVARSYVETGTPRGRVVKIGDGEFDDAYVVSIAESVDVRMLLTPKARQALLAIPGGELMYRDGVAVLSWPCDKFLGADAGDDDYAAIEFGYDALVEVAKAARTKRAAR